MCNKVINILGPTMSGKTFVNTAITFSLCQSGLKFGNVNFEQVFKSKLSLYERRKEFCGLIKEKLDLHKLVIAESVFLNVYGIDCSSLTVLCYPNRKAIKDNLEKYKLSYGKSDLKKRIVFNIDVMMDDFDKNYKDTPNTIVYNGKNLEEVLEKVKEYVIN